MCQLCTFLYILRWFFSLVITQWPIFQPTRLAFKPRGKASERSAFMRGSVSIFVICLLVKDRRQWLSIGLCCGNKHYKNLCCAKLWRFWIEMKQYLRRILQGRAIDMTVGKWGGGGPRGMSFACFSLLLQQIFATFKGRILK